MTTAEAALTLTHIRIPAGGHAWFAADLAIPSDARGLVIFAHGSGSGRMSPRNRFVASELNSARMATLLADLLTEDEEAADSRTAEFRFDIPLLTHRVLQAIDWSGTHQELMRLPIGIFGASTGAAAALDAASLRPAVVHAVVSRGGRPDLAVRLHEVKAPTLLIVGGNDPKVIELNEDAMRRLRCTKELRIVPGATHLFEEPGTLESVAASASAWFSRHLVPLPEIV